jgi:hypothetical protein
MKSDVVNQGAGSGPVQLFVTGTSTEIDCAPSLMNTGTLTIAVATLLPSIVSVIAGLFGRGIVLVNVIAEPDAGVGGNAVTLLGELELTKKLVAGLIVCVVPC